MSAINKGHENEDLELLGEVSGDDPLCVFLAQGLTDCDRRVWRV